MPARFRFLVTCLVVLVAGIRHAPERYGGGIALLGSADVRERDYPNQAVFTNDFSWQRVPRGTDGDECADEFFDARRYSGRRLNQG